MSTVIRTVGEEVGKRPNDKWKVNRVSRGEVNTRERTEQDGKKLMQKPNMTERKWERDSKN
jgi:hypothetical protein